jgi:hypothetical protein
MAIIKLVFLTYMSFVEKVFSLKKEHIKALFLFLLF